MKLLGSMMLGLIVLMCGFGFSTVDPHDAWGEDTTRVLKNALSKWKKEFASEVKNLEQFSSDWNSVLQTTEDESAQKFVVDPIRLKKLTGSDITSKLARVLVDPKELKKLQGAAKRRNEWLDWLVDRAAREKSPLAEQPRDVLLEKWLVGRVVGVMSCSWPCPPPPPPPPRR